ncbi:actin-related protein 6 [Magnolia sinica]|uniref:actin-related protein 6 n=1 Tax=Magnolia sinica TaxID=86752 RepID=UPI002658DA09|nr:actin-related protein 6 [Magnolia sinica]
MSNVVVLDNGGGLCKAGIGGDRDPVAVVPNCIARSSSSSSSSSKHHPRWLVADQLLQSGTDPTSLSLRRPIDRGYLINPDLQRDIWDHILRSILHVDPHHSSLLLVEPLFNPPSIQRSTDELVFEDLGFRSLYVADSPSLVHLYEASRRPGSVLSRTQCSLVVDCGFSFTHAAPVLQNFTLNYGVKRLDLGGKALTNYLKELISYRSINVMDETFIIDDVKEKLCFVSLDVPRDLQIARKPGKDNILKCTYVLPDGITHTKGFVKDMDEAQRYLTPAEGAPPPKPESKEEIDDLEDAEKPEDRRRIDLTKNEFNLTNERFLVPEMLFHPSDLGMNEAGLAECIVRAVNSCHPHLHPVLFESIILTGGSTLFPRFAERLERELRPLVQDDYQVKIASQEDPIRGVWRGGSLLASSPDFEAMCVTKSEYEELGSARCRHRFFH